MTLLLCILFGMTWLGLGVLYCFFEQDKKNFDSRLKVEVEKLEKTIKSNHFHMKKDIQIWTGQADQGRKEFKKFEETYIHHMSQVCERLETLEDILKAKGSEKSND